MCDGTQEVLAAQTEIGRRLRGDKVSLKVIASRAGWHINTLNAYFPASAETRPTKLPAGALFDLLRHKALPNDLLALLFPDGWAPVQIPDGVDHDELAALAHDYLQEKTAAHHPDSEAGPAIGPNEAERLNAKATRLQVAS